ncbi:MAG: prolyl oligopeptidase family serine peptidase [Fimbriimonadaceae bacterium]|nr:prolyl oligopeptidase family serine peptidase [Fimbriimonadaceae bacterium]
MDASPDLDWFRVTTGVEPFTYTFPASSFARREALVSADGKEAAELSRRNLPGARPARSSGRRALAWHPAGDGMVFLFKDDKTKKDSIRHWTAPFGEKDVKVLWESETDIASAQFTSDMASLLVRRTEKEETVFDLVPLAGGEPVRVFAFKPGDFYANPGDFVTLPGPKTGRVVLRDSEGRFLLSGTQYDKDPVKNPPRPFLDRVKIGAEKPERIWQSPADAFETATVMDDSVQTLLITRQTATETPNSHMLTLAGKSSRQLTFNKDLLPEVTQLRRERIQITRADGFKFWTEVIMPRFAINGVGRKAFFWFYPSEVVDQKSYDDGERTLNLNAFRRTTPNSAQLLALLGYVVVLPDCPIVGPSDRPNDTYPLQLRNNLWAVVDELDRRELIDRRYLAIGGHSYGAFSTAHAMIQTPFFKAGIAGAGNYNRTLTPFGFQREQRKLWDNAGMYVEMSPIMRADQLTGALLMYHGADDQNVGTFPINSLRMFDALEALGKTASLYVYPGEDHGQIALETRLDMWARWIAWLEKYVK